MSVRIQELTKIYGDKKALDGISFEACKGQVTGFLGPNGAGKTTTMKILSCYMLATDGKASVCGFDTRTQAKEVKSRVGYLPEHNPLYKDMYVREYLRFIAGLHDVAHRSRRVQEVIDMTGLGREQHKKIQALSKGYRQRVGLAQALIHEPEVLILDEPTSGLDPNQLADIRQLILDLGKEKTVILSTHIMQEVEALCDQIVIINQGRIVADGSLSELKARAEDRGVEVIAEFDRPVDLQAKFQHPAVLSMQASAGNRKWVVSSHSQDDLRAEIFHFAAKEDELALIGLSRKAYEVEDVFRSLTQ